MTDSSNSAAAITGLPPLLNGLINTGIQDAVGWAGAALLTSGFLSTAQEGQFLQLGAGLLTLVVAGVWGQVRERMHRTNVVAALNAPAPSPPAK